MNTQIKKLMVQAWVDAEGQDQGVVSEDGLTIRGILQQDMEAIFAQFAELIVRECMKVVINGKYSATECEGNTHRIAHNNARDESSSDIKKHFGVIQ